MITKTQATQATHGQIFYHVTERNADGTALRVRVSGKCYTWKTRPTHFSLPVKYGLYSSLRIDHNNAGDWLTSDPTEESADDRAYGAPGSAKRSLIVGGFIAEMKRIGMASHNDEETKRAQLLDAPSDRLRLLAALVKSY